MFKTLLALALTVNLAASLTTCYSGLWYFYGAGCDDDAPVDTDDEISEWDITTYVSAGMYDVCMYYTVDAEESNGCTYTTTTWTAGGPSISQDFAESNYAMNLTT